MLKSCLLRYFPHLNPFKSIVCCTEISKTCILWHYSFSIVCFYLCILNSCFKASKIYPPLPKKKNLKIPYCLWIEVYSLIYNSFIISHNYNIKFLRYHRGGVFLFLWNWIVNNKPSIENYEILLIKENCITFLALEFDILLFVYMDLLFSSI